MRLQLLKRLRVFEKFTHFLKAYALERTGYYIQSTREEVHLSGEMNV